MKRLLARLLVLVMVFGMGGAGVAEGAGSVEKEKLLEAYASLMNAANELLGAALGAEEESTALTDGGAELTEESAASEMAKGYMQQRRGLDTFLYGYAIVSGAILGETSEISLDSMYDGYDPFIHSKVMEEEKMFLSISGSPTYHTLRMEIAQDALDDAKDQIMVVYYAFTTDSQSLSGLEDHIKANMETDWEHIRSIILTGGSIFEMNLREIEQEAHVSTFFDERNGVYVIVGRLDSW